MGSRIREWFGRLTGQRLVILLGTSFVAADVLAVFWHVLGLSQIGLHCTFRPMVTRVYTELLPKDPAEPYDNLIGTDIVRLGDEKVESWPELLRRLEKIGKHDFPPLNALDEVPPEANYVTVDSTRWVRIGLTRPGDNKPLTVWSQVSTTQVQDMLPSLIWFVFEMVVLTVASIVSWNRPNDRAARQFLLFTLVVVCAFMNGYHWWRIVTSPVLATIYISCAVLLPAVGLHFFELFPRPKPWLRRQSPAVLALTYGPSLVFAGLILTGYYVVRNLSRGNGTTDEIKLALEGLKLIIFTYYGVAALLYLASVVCLAHSYRYAGDDVERNQVRWIFIGSVLAMVPLGYTFFLAIWRRESFSGGGALWPMFTASICFTTAFTISITRYRLVQLEKLVSFSVAYFLVSCLAASIYYVVVFLGTMAFGDINTAGPSLFQAFWVSGSSLLLYVALDFARGRMRRALDRRFRRNKTQLDRTLQQLGEAIEQLVDPPTLARRMLHATADLLGVADGVVYLREDDGPVFRVVGHVGRQPRVETITGDGPLLAELAKHELFPPRVPGVAFDPRGGHELHALGGAIAAGLTHEGVLRVVLVLGPKFTGKPFADEELNLLEAFVPFTAVALASAEGHRTIEQLNRELQSKVDKISEQQRRILALQQQLTSQTRVAVVREPRPTAESAVPGIVGSAASLRQVLALARKVAASPSAVLIRGESGTGKELLAQAVHDYSPRAGKAFVKVHCAALAPGILESELFGHVKGAFTGAVRDKPGRFEVADGGTLFLDEIGDIGPDVQTKLLRVLQEKTLERVGSNESIRVDVRLVAATHQNLEQLIRQGRFREDLFYRLNVIALSMPPLRERRDDVPELASHFLKVYATRAGKTVEGIDDDALLVLRDYHWPGNIRELENAIERAVVIADGPTVGVDDLPEEVLRSQPTGGAGEWADDGDTRGVSTERAERHARERESLVGALAATNGNKAEAARLLGMARSTLVSRLKKFGLLN